MNRRVDVDHDAILILSWISLVIVMEYLWEYILGMTGWNGVAIGQHGREDLPTQNY